MRDQKKPNTWGLRHPSETVVAAVVELTSASCEARKATLTLKQTSALLNHLRMALGGALSATATDPPGRCVFCAAGLSTDRALLVDAATALRHVRDCGACGEDSWTSCATGGQHADRTLAAIDAALGLPDPPEVQS